VPALFITAANSGDNVWDPLSEKIKIRAKIQPETVWSRERRGCYAQTAMDLDPNAP
jgi:hypothetical protein